MSEIQEKSEGLEIPDIPDELILPVRCLAGAAYLFRGVFIQMIEGKPLSEIVEERGDYILLVDKVVNVWAEHFKLDEDEYPSVSPLPKSSFKAD